MTIGWEKKGRKGKQYYEGTNVASFNIGVGYYKEHTLDEYVRFSEIKTAISDVERIINNMPNKKYLAQ